MVFKVKYDPANNVNFVKCVGKYPACYKNNREGETEAWEQVAKEVKSTAYVCKDRWKRLVLCYRRYLKQKAVNAKKKPYYLAKYMEFVKPYISLKLKGEEKLSQSFADVHSDLDSDDITIEDIDEINANVKMEECTDFSMGPICIIDSSDDEAIVFETAPVSSDCSETNSRHDSFERETNVSEDCDENLDFCFFKSLLPDLRLMTPQQQMKFRKEVLNALDIALYTEDYYKNISILKPDTNLSKREK